MCLKWLQKHWKRSKIIKAKVLPVKTIHARELPVKTTHVRAHAEFTIRDQCRKSDFLA